MAVHTVRFNPEVFSGDSWRVAVVDVDAGGVLADKAFFPMGEEGNINETY